MILKSEILTTTGLRDSSLCVSCTGFRNINGGITLTAGGSVVRLDGEVATTSGMGTPFRPTTYNFSRTTLLDISLLAPLSTESAELTTYTENLLKPQMIL